MVLAGQVAVAVVGVAVNVLAEGDAVEAVVAGDDGEIPVGRSAGQLMLQLLHVAQRVVAVTLAIGTGAGRVGAARQVQPGRGIRRLVAFAAGGRQQPVDRVVVELADQGIA